MSDPVDVTHKSHREHKSGRKAEKKKQQKEKKSNNVSERPRNPKAFTFNSAVGAERRFRRKEDLNTKKTHIPHVDRTPVEPPPILVAVVGPPKVGKSLLIHCLIKNFTRDPPRDIKGPVTVVSGKKQRITFMECNNDLNSMIDIAKVADLVLLLIDASFGFEMEVFEFLNICQVHGMPRIMGVLTHLDLIKNSAKLKKTKKLLKHRFWTEVYDGAKLFYLSGQVHNEYMRNEIKNLARFISVKKFRQLTWRSSHPYILADRIEDMTDAELVKKNPKVDRTVCFYGYMRGCPLRKDSSVHIPGVGDLKIKDVSYLPDPCPLPEALKKRALIEKERLVYAPFSGAGGIIYDKDAVYVDLGGSHSHKEEDNELISGLIDTKGTLDEKLEKSELKLFSESKGIMSKEVDEVFGKQVENVFDGGRMRRRVNFDNNEEIDGESDGEEDDDDEEDLDESIDTLEQNGKNLFGNMEKEDDNEDEEEEEEEEDEDEDEEDDEGEEVQGTRVLERIDESDEDLDEGFEDKSMDGGSSRINSEQCEEEDDDDDDEDDFEDDSEDDELNCEDSSKRKRSEKSKTSDENSKETSKKLKINDNDSEEGSTESKSENNLMNKKNNSSELSAKISETLKKLEERKLVKENEEESNDELSDNDSEGSTEEMEVDESRRWTRTAEEARQEFENRRRNIRSLMKLVYDVEQVKPEEKEEDKEEEVGGLFRMVSEKQKKKIEGRELEDHEDTDFYSQDPPSEEVTAKRSQDERAFLIQGWRDSEDASELLKLDDLKENDDDEEVYGDFEDLETGEKFEAKSEKPEEKPKDEDEERKKLLEKKRKLKQQFDAQYDDAETQNYYEELKREVEKQAQLNRSEFEGLDDYIRVQVEGFRPGMYVRVEIGAVSCELLEHFDPTYPLILGGLLRGEENIGLVQTKFKKHRWYPKILKTRNPLIMSVGWRRFQTMMIYAKLEDNMRQRMLKYTPQHVACMGHFWGPITPLGTGFLAVQDVNSRSEGFRIVATGSVTELDKNTRIVKKLKLIGEPKRIFKKTAYIGGMFNSELEIAKFQGAKIKTVSGIRGVVKKSMAIKGWFRATFEDKIQLSDIVFCRTWVRIEVPHYYNPVINLLLPHGKKNEWKGMRTVAELKKDNNIVAKPQDFKDSLYTPIERTEKVFQPLKIPKNLQKALPYRDKPKLQPLAINHKPQYTERRVAVVRSKQEAQRSDLMKKIRTLYNYKLKKDKEDTKKRMAEYKKRVEAEELKQLKKQKVLKKQIFSTLSKMDKKDKNKR